MAGAPRATLRIGTLGKPHGLRGEVPLRFDNPRSLVRSLHTIEIGTRGGRETRRVEKARPIPDGLLLSIEGVTNRDAAAAITLAEVFVARADLPPPPEGGFYVEDLPGSQVLDEAGRVLGVVRGTFWNGAHDVMTVDGARERLIPVVPAHVLAFDGAAGRVTVRWDEDEA